MAIKNNQLLHTFVILAYQESAYLEDCIQSVVNQTYKSKVIIATTTLNQHIKTLAQKYDLEIIEGVHTNIGGDFDFAIHAAKTPLVTVAHQDDIYKPDYAAKIIDAYHKYPHSSIIFTDYFEIRRQKHVYTNANLKIKRLLLFPIRLKKSLQSSYGKRFLLKYGNAICCPAVTFIVKKCPKELFSSHFKCDCDWHAWEKLSKKQGAFTFISQPLMGHRVSESSTTTKTINSGLRTKEDYEIFCRFWPRPIAKFLTRLYQNSEKSNTLKKKRS